MSMKIFENYKEYQKYEPQYKVWKEEKDLKEAKKLAYLKENPVDEKTKQTEIQRGKALMHAINVMDEYSQSRAENMEIATQQVVSQASLLVEYAGVFLGTTLLFVPKVKKALKSLGTKFPKFAHCTPFIPIIVGALAGMAVGSCMQGWAAGKEVGASRKGRFEAIQKDLSDPKVFAVLTDDQKAKQKKIASKIPTTKDMKKGVVAEKSNMMNPLNAFKVLKDLAIGDKKLELEREAFDKSLYKGEDKNLQLSENDLLKAQKDKQLLHNIVEKIDMKSQDYAENIELATGVLGVLSGVGGGIAGFVTKKVLNFLKVSNSKAANMISWGIALALGIGGAIFATSIQKQGSRVGRYIAKKEIEQDMNNYVYLSDEKINSVKGDVKPNIPQKPNFFKFLVQVIKDNFEYKNYVKTKGVEHIKEQMALKDIQLTDEQIKEAKQLQKNTFKTFNKLDEKSQLYAESVEAVGNTIQMPVTGITSLVGLSIGTYFSTLLMRNSKNVSQFVKSLPVIGAAAGIIPAIALNWIFTRKQKQASRVAHMLALNEMQDVKKYVDYENLEKVENKDNKTKLGADKK